MMKLSERIVETYWGKDGSEVLIAKGVLDDWTDWVMHFEYKIDKLETENATIRKIYRRIQAADHPGLELPVEMTAAMAEMTALLKEPE